MEEQILSGGVTGVIVMVLYAVYKVFKKSSCSSKCCGVESKIRIDLQDRLLKHTSTSDKSTQTSPEEDSVV